MKDKGFTLIEVVAATLIITVGLVTVLGALSYAHRAQLYQQDRLTASYVLQRAMEEARAKDFATDVSIPWSGFPEFPRFTYQVTEEKPYQPPLALKKIDVTVEWTTPGWTTQQASITTLAADR